MPRVAVKDAVGVKSRGGGKGGGSTKGSNLPFEEARAAVQTIKLGSNKEWIAWSKSGQRPSNIPANPRNVYRDDGWISYPDWLGYEGVHGNMLPFAMARAIVRKLKLKNWKAWQVWSKAGQRPTNIPATPNRSYRDDGWISMHDWLGYGSEGGSSGSSSSSFSSSSSVTQKKKKKKKKKKKNKSVAPKPPPARSKTNGAPSRKRARAASGSDPDPDSDDATLGNSGGPLASASRQAPARTRTASRMQEVWGSMSSRIISSASDLNSH